MMILKVPSIADEIQYDDVGVLMSTDEEGLDGTDVVLDVIMLVGLLPLMCRWLMPEDLRASCYGILYCSA